jgi:predicted alpha/beta hydrolase
MKKSLEKESFQVSVAGGQQLHVLRLFANASALGLPVLMLHGEHEAGSVFYNEQGEGAAAWLAYRGYDVYVPDMRGKGKSWPLIGPNSEYGFHELITQDLPAVIKAISRRSDGLPQFWFGHGLGGVWLMSYLARFGQQHVDVVGNVQFSSRRRITSDHWKKRLLVDRYWAGLGSGVTKFKGFLPAKKLGLGEENETCQSFNDSVSWADGPWIDPVDQFDYGHEAGAMILPAGMYFSTEGDRSFAVAEDVRAFVKELAPHDARIVVLGDVQIEGQSAPHRYHQASLLTDRYAYHDLFPGVFEWMSEKENQLELVVDGSLV